MRGPSLPRMGHWHTRTILYILRRYTKIVLTMAFTPSRIASVRGSGAPTFIAVVSTVVQNHEKYVSELQIRTSLAPIYRPRL